MSTPASPFRIAGLVALLGVLGCAHAPPRDASGTTEVRAAIERVYAEFSAAMVRGDAAAVAALFTADGEVLPATASGFITGTAALQAWYAGRMKAVRFLVVELKPIALEVSGDLAWETGTNRVVTQAGDAPPVTRTGKYLVAWRRGPDGLWRMRADAVILDPAG